MANFPTITYTNLKHKVDNGVSGGVVQSKDEAITLVFNNGIGTAYKYRASFNSPHNQITGTLNSNRELSKWQVRVTPVEVDDFGPEVGNRATLITGISANTNTNFTIPITQAVFTGSPTNTYRICLMGQSSLDYSWDCTQLYMVIDTNTSFTNSYTEVEYLETNDNQIINTNVDDKIGICVDCDMEALDDGKRQYWYGSTQGPNGGSMMYNGLYNNTGLEFNWLTVSRTASRRCIMTQRISGDNYIITMNGQTYTKSKGTVQPTGKMYIFGCNSGNRKYGAGLRCYYFKIYDNSTLIRDLVPCIRNSDNKPGMYDRVNNVFYTNQGSGEFKYGPLKSVPQTYQQVEYIEGDGNQRMTPFRIDKSYTGNLTVGYKFTVSSHTDAMYFSTITANLSAGQAYSLGYTGASSSLYIRWNQIANSTTQVAYTIPEVLEITRTNYIENITLGEVSLFAHSTSYKPWKGKIYKYWLEINSSYIFNMIPCYRKSDNVIGMLDLVNNVFYTNAGSGTFTKGNNVNNINYIKYKPTDYDGYDVHFVN